LFLIGSCFTENIGEKLKTYKFSVLENPNGILFNPVSVAEAMASYIDNVQVKESDLFQFDQGWHSWKHHSRFSGLNAEEAIRKINTSTSHAHSYLKETSYLMITLGSSWIYTLTEKALNATAGSVAANNHKAPADWFNRRLMSIEEVLQVLNSMLRRLFLFNPKLKIIFTISPVRHLREGVVENNRSKAVLIQAVHQMVDQFDRLYYFPSYELIIDDLRDYRFYAEDLVHPNYFATQYVWEKFVDACISEEAKALMKEIHLINLAYRHKPFNEKTEAHKSFKLKYLEKVRHLQDQFPFLDFSKEIDHFSL
jgi:hypothetical protein